MSDGIEDHPIMRLHIRVYKAVNDGSGKPFLARIEGCQIGPHYGDTAMGARRAADDWRRAEVAKEMARRAAAAKRVEAMKRARAEKAGAGAAVDA